MIDLLGSIRLQYPIGSLLVWEADVPLASTEWVGPVWVSLNNQGIASHVLDGQQRLSTLVGVLQKPRGDQIARTDLDDPERWRIWFNARTKNFEHPKSGEEMQAWHFPLWKLMDTIEFLEECRRIVDSGHPESGAFVASIQDLSRTFNSYKLPVIRIKSTKLSQAVDIFARLNSKGQTMSADQMVSALSYAENQDGQPLFNLAEKIDELINRLDDLDFGGIDRTIVLRAFLTALGEDIYRTDWTRLTEDKRAELSKGLPAVIAETGDALERAVKFLHGIGVQTNRLLPYAMQLIVLCAFFLRCASPTEAQLKFLRQWFWVSSFTARFASSNPSRDGYLVAEFRDEVSQIAEPTLLKNMRLDVPAEPFPATFDMRSARARTLLLVILSLAPKHLDGAEVPEPWRRIAEHGPNATGKLLATVKSKELASSPANRILRIDLRDRSQAKNWLLKLAEKPEDVRGNVLESHGIPYDAFPLLMSGDADAFLRSRRDYLIQIEKSFMESEGVVPPPDLEPKLSAIDTE
ncbi:hypothetical protein J2847_000427 [Azospirillum agricola]|nr:hypothetical protein [Azospirillum agricola]